MNKIWYNTRTVALDEGKHDEWQRIMEYNSPSGASVAISGIKNGTVQHYTSNKYLFAFTARVHGDKSRLYAYCIPKEGAFQ